MHWQWGGWGAGPSNPICHALCARLETSLSPALKLILESMGWELRVASWMAFTDELQSQVYFLKVACRKVRMVLWLLGCAIGMWDSQPKSCK